MFASIIGIASIIFGIYAIVEGEPLIEYVFQLSLGICLIGSAYFNNKEWDNYDRKN